MIGNVIRSMENRPAQHTRGFTTLELVTSVTILSLLSLVVIEVILMAQIVWDNSFTHVKLQKEATRSMQTMVKYLREADPSSPIGIDIRPEQEQITFGIPKEVTAGTTSGWIQVDFIYDVNTQELSKVTIDGTTIIDEVIGRFISQCTFTRNAGRINVDLRSAMNSARGRPLAIDLMTEVTMRN